MRNKKKWAIINIFLVAIGLVSGLYASSFYIILAVVGYACIAYALRIDSSENYGALMLGISGLLLITIAGVSAFFESLLF